jgi:hypothetical protein
MCMQVSQGVRKWDVCAGYAEERARFDAHVPSVDAGLNGRVRIAQGYARGTQVITARFSGGLVYGLLCGVAILTLLFFACRDARERKPRARGRGITTY